MRVIFDRDIRISPSQCPTSDAGLEDTIAMMLNSDSDLSSDIAAKNSFDCKELWPCEIINRDLTSVSKIINIVMDRSLLFVFGNDISMISNNRACFWGIFENHYHYLVLHIYTQKYFQGILG